MRAVTPGRQSAAQPPSHPSGQMTDGGGTWNEGRPAFTPQPPSDSRGSPVPSISVRSEGGESPSFAASLPDKGGGAGPPAALLEPGAKRAEPDAAAWEGGPHDPCTAPSAKHPDGSQQQQKAEPPPGPQYEVACRRGDVHSKERGRGVASAAAPDGAFGIQSGEVKIALPQGPAGASGGMLQKSEGYGTAHVSVGSCAPEGPSMTVKTPPEHPAFASAPRPRPPPSVPAFGARAALPRATDGDAETRAPRGLSVSSVHISGPLAVAGPRLPRQDALAEAPDDALADEQASVGQRQSAAPGGTAVPDQGAKAAGMFTPGTGQAAAAAGGGGGGGPGTPAHQHAGNKVRIDEIRDEKKDNARDQKIYDNTAAKKKNTLEFTLSKDLGRDLGELQGLRDESAALNEKKAQLSEQRRKETHPAAKEAIEKGIKDTAAAIENKDKAIAVKAAQINENYNALDDAKSPKNYKEIPPEVRKESESAEAAKDKLVADAAEAERNAKENKEKGRRLQEEEDNLQYKNRKLEDEMDPADRARSDREEDRIRERRERDREREAERRRKKIERDERRRQRPGYRAGQRAKARRSLARASRLKDKATRLRNAARNPNLSKSAKRNLLKKAKKLTQKREAAAWKALEAAREAGDGKAEADAIAEIKAAQEEEKAIGKQEEELEAEGQPPAPPPPDPCSLPCPCNITCPPGEACVCERKPADPTGPGGDPAPPGGGGGAGAVPPPDIEIKVPEGQSVAEEPAQEEEDGGVGKEPPPERGDGRRSVVAPGTTAGPRVTAPPGTTTVARPEPKPRPVRYRSWEVPPPYCADCRSALESPAVQGGSDEAAAECLWAALGSRWKGGDWESPIKAAYALGGWQEGWTKLREILTALCLTGEQQLNPELNPELAARAEREQKSRAREDSWSERLSRYWRAAKSVAEGSVEFLARLLGAAFGVGLRVGLFLASFILGKSKPTMEELLEPLLDLLAGVDFTDLTPFQEWAVEMLAAALEGVDDPWGTFAGIGKGIVDSPKALAQMLRDAVNGDEEAQIGLLIIAVTFRPGRTIATARSIVGIVRSVGPKVLQAMRRLGVTAKDLIAALRSRIRIRRGSTTEYVGDKVRVRIDENGKITDISGPGDGPPTGSPAQPPGSAPAPSEPPRKPKGGRVGDLFTKEERQLVNDAVERNRPLSDVPTDLRARYAAFLRNYKLTGTERAIREGRLYNEARAQFLEGKRGPPGVRPDFFNEPGAGGGG